MLVIPAMAALRGLTRSLNGDFGVALRVAIGNREFAQHVFGSPASASGR